MTTGEHDKMFSDRKTIGMPDSDGVQKLSSRSSRPKGLKKILFSIVILSIVAVLIWEMLSRPDNRYEYSVILEIEESISENPHLSILYPSLRISDNDLARAIQHLRSRAKIEAILRDYNLIDSAQVNDTEIANILNAIRSDVIIMMVNQGGRLLELSFKHNNPEKCKQFLDAFVYEFISYLLAQQEMALTQALEQLEVDLQLYKQQVSDTQEGNKTSERIYSIIQESIEHINMARRIFAKERDSRIQVVYSSEVSQ